MMCPIWLIIYVYICKEIQIKLELRKVLSIYLLQNYNLKCMIWPESIISKKWDDEEIWNKRRLFMDVGSCESKHTQAYGLQTQHEWILNR